MHELQNEGKSGRWKRNKAKNRLKKIKKKTWKKIILNFSQNTWI
jgi:hypothetical protein